MIFGKIQNLGMWLPIFIFQIYIITIVSSEICFVLPPVTVTFAGQLSHF